MGGDECNPPEGRPAMKKPFLQGSIVAPPTTRGRLDEAMKNAQPHLRPIIEAVRDYNVDMLFIPQGAGAFRIPAKHPRPVIYLVGDDFDCAEGPEGFHMPSLRRVIRQSKCFAVISSEPQQDAYTTMAATACAVRCNTLIIETRPEQEIQWVHLIQKLAPKRFIWLATVKGGNA